MGQRSLVLSLYRQLLRESAKFESYNFRSYALRRVRDGFRANFNAQDASRNSDLIADAQRNLEIIRRQVILGKLYPSNKLVIENKVGFNWDFTVCDSLSKVLSMIQSANWMKPLHSSHLLVLLCRFTLFHNIAASICNGINCTVTFTEIFISW